MTSPLDDLDARLIDLMARRAADRADGGLPPAGVARGTVQARLAKLTERGVIRGFGPEVEPARMGYPVTAFVFLEITQGRLTEAIAHLEAVPEVLEAHATSGPARPARARRRARHGAAAGHHQPPARHLGGAQVDQLHRALTQIAHRTGPLVQAAAEAA